MILLTPDLRFALRANAICHEAAQRDGRAEPDPVPVVKFFNPVGGAAQGSSDAQHRWNGGGGAATWLACRLDRDGDTLFGLADLGFGCPELGSFSLREIENIHLPFGLGIERDLQFETPPAISVWANEARAAGSILGAAHNLSNRLPTKPDPDGSGGVG